MAFRLLTPYSKTLNWNKKLGKNWSDWMDDTQSEDPIETPGRQSRHRDESLENDPASRSEDDGREVRRGGALDGGDDTFRTIEREEASVSPWSFTGRIGNAVLGTIGGGTIQNILTNDLIITPINIWIDWNGDDEFFGTDGVDLAYGLWGDDDIFLFDGNDTAYGGFGNDLIVGGRGDDRLFGGTGNDVLSGDVGNDTLEGEDGNDVLLGGHGNDLMKGGDGNDRIEGGFGNDAVRAGDGDDRVEGEDGNDTLWGEAGRDTILGGDGDDQVFGGLGNDLLQGGLGDDHLEGGGGSDVMVGDQGNDLMNGGSSNDQMSGGQGDDDMDGGTGNDIMEGDDGDDVMHGRDGADQMFGGAGNDYIQGGDGNDSITGGTNSAGDTGDYMLGGAGFDVFYFKAGDSGGASGPMDVIEDFTQGGDLVVIEGFFANFLGEQNGFSNAPGAEAYFEHAQSGIHGDVTNIYVRDGIGLDADLSFSMLGHIDLTQNDLFIV